MMHLRSLMKILFKNFQFGVVCTKRQYREFNGHKAAQVLSSLSFSQLSKSQSKISKKYSKVFNFLLENMHLENKRCASIG